VKAQLFRNGLNFWLMLLTRVASAEPHGQTHGQTLFVNGNVYTGVANQPHAEAIAVMAGRVAFVGSNAEARKHAAGAVQVDLAGRTVVPGLTDSHCHIFGIGERELNLNLEGANSREDFLARVRGRGYRSGG
jgi:predicted amidohydrolase YtcJ